MVNHMVEPYRKNMAERTIIIIIITWFKHTLCHSQ